MHIRHTRCAWRGEKERDTFCVESALWNVVYRRLCSQQYLYALPRCREGGWQPRKFSRVHRAASCYSSLEIPRSSDLPSRFSRAFSPSSWPSCPHSASSSLLKIPAMQYMRATMLPRCRLASRNASSCPWPQLAKSACHGSLCVDRNVSSPDLQHTNWGKKSKNCTIHELEYSGLLVYMRLQPYQPSHVNHSTYFEVYRYLATMYFHNVEKSQ